MFTKSERELIYFAEKRYGCGEAFAALLAYEHEFNRKYKKVVEDFYYADMDGMEMFLDTIGYHCRVGLKFWRSTASLGDPNAEILRVKECGNGYSVRLVTYVTRKH